MVLLACLREKYSYRCGFAGQLFFRSKPIFDIPSVFAVALKIQLVGSASDLISHCFLGLMNIAGLPSLFRNRVYAGHNLACGDISGEVLTGQDPFQRAEHLLHFGARGHNHIFSLLANACLSPFGHDLEYGSTADSR